MKNKLTYCTMTAVVFVFANLAGVCAQEDAMMKAADSMKKMDPMAEQMVKYGSPGEPHKILESLAGQWTYTTKWWMSADAAPEESQGTSENTMILGGRFLKQDVQGLSMGQPFEGIGIVGYDNIKGEYSSIWIDSMMTGIMSAAGQYDAATKTLTETGSLSCPVTGEKHKPFRGELKIIDNDHYAYSMYSMGPDGQEFKGFEITYTRAGR